MPTPPQPTFFIQARRKSDGLGYELDAGWDIISPPLYCASHSTDSRVGRALALIEAAIGKPPVQQPRVAACSQG